MSPIAIKLGEIKIHWYGVMMAVGFLAGYFVMTIRAKKTGFSLPMISDIVITGVIGGIVGSRIYYVISYWEHFKAACEKEGFNPYIRMFYIHEGGLVFLGGFIGAALTISVMVYLRWTERGKRLQAVKELTIVGVSSFAAGGLITLAIFGASRMMDFEYSPATLLLPFGALAFVVTARIFFKQPRVLEVADLAAIAIPLGHAFGRVGCFLNGCCFGKPTGTEYGVQYPVGTYGYITRTQDKLGILEKGAKYCADVHPVQLYSSIANLSIFLVLFFIVSRFVKKQGQLFACFLMLYPIGRFTCEFFRGDHDEAHYHGRWLWDHGFSDAQSLAPLIFLAGVGLFIYASKYGHPVKTAVDATADKTNELKENDAEA